ncbi:transcriptional repressor of the fructose operon, DeoR family [Melissococcus plutonius ATCC 35311]|uniref:Transcriptional repressor of the fructose operon, DeoR family n=2 Tax=Melissococcus plutonius TaxID=33970 RepID=F3Y9E8_MELPT|nr:DeoR family fructose operon transcriptional repressor [Melissococcus plutonius]BAK21126.1 transcriptional repressor of the fructose operon, DeoR family [Melissococcus plutonius ATCC 35311]
MIVKTQELTALLNTSESTIRRDLKELADANLLERIHGGARLLLNLSFEQNMTEKADQNN